MTSTATQYACNFQPGVPMNLIGGTVREWKRAEPCAIPTVRALAPRFGGTSLFYLSSRGTGDGLWRYQDGKAEEIWKGADGALLEPPAISADLRM
jgi:hypothetical protein